MTTTPTPTPESVIARLRKMAADWNVQKLVSWHQQANDNDVQEFYRQTNQVEHLCAAAADACEALIRERDEGREIAAIARERLGAAGFKILVEVKELRTERDSLKEKLNLAMATLNEVEESPCDDGIRARIALAKIKEMP